MPLQAEFTASQLRHGINPYGLTWNPGGQVAHAACLQRYALLKQWVAIGDGAGINMGFVQAKAPATFVAFLAFLFAGR